MLSPQYTNQRQLSTYPRVRINRSWLQYFLDHWSYQNDGSLYLFSLTALMSYANFRSCTKKIDGHSYRVSSGEWICRLISLFRILHVSTRKDVLHRMAYFQELGLLTYHLLPQDPDEEWLHYSITNWDKFGVCLPYEYYSYKTNGFFFFPLSALQTLENSSRSRGECVFSELDAVVDMWLHMVYKDSLVQGSDVMPVLSYPDLSGRPLVSCAYLARRWGWSKSHAYRLLRRLEHDNMICRFCFPGTSGSVISIPSYIESICDDTVQPQDLGQMRPALEVTSSTVPYLPHDGQNKSNGGAA